MRDLEIEHGAPPRPAIVRLRVALPSAALAAGALALPRAACTADFGDPQRLWIGPDQWLLASTTQTADSLIALCARALVGVRHHAVDASAAFDRIVLRGEAARTLLAMGCGLDLRALDPGACVRTRLARIPTVIVSRDLRSVELLVDRSHGGYLARWFVRAATDPLVAA